MTINGSWQYKTITDYLSMTLGVIKMWRGWGTSYINPIDDHPDSNFILDRLSLSISPGS